MDGPGESVDDELALFNGTSGTNLKRASGSGLLKAASGVLSFLTKLPIELGGTNAITKSGARSSLELVPGTHVQAQNPLLADIAGASLSQGDVLYYDGSNIVNLGAGVSGQRLTTKGAGSDPIWAGGHSYAEYLTYSSHTNVIPLDDSIPQITEGDQILSTAFAASSSSATVRITTCIMGLDASSSNSAPVVAVFNGATNAINSYACHVVGNVAIGNMSTNIFEYVPGTSSSKTYTVRVGPTSGTMYVNGSSSARLFGGNMKSTIIVEEIA
jgi:hypothetical protein